MIKIRLARVGAKNQPKYRIVAADEKFKRDGRFLEILGQYDPTRRPSAISINKNRLEHWVSRGAKPTETVSRLVSKL